MESEVYVNKFIMFVVIRLPFKVAWSLMEKRAIMAMRNKKVHIPPVIVL